ncbi:MAG: VWA domain-containing protein [Pseudomonadota bacterium]
MRKRVRREVEAMSLSFLDTIACGFGAIILLLVITKVFEPIVLEETEEELDGTVAKLQEELYEIIGETKTFRRDLIVKQDQVSAQKNRVARLRGDLSDILGQFNTTKDNSIVAEDMQGRLASARQKLSEEMQRLAKLQKKVDPSLIGGIPVDSEYVIFVIDTSGSMLSNAWDLVILKMQETLDVHPEVKGIQIMNDMGQYMFQSYRDRWIPDTPKLRRTIVDRMRTWDAFSNSSPVEGITTAVDTFYEPGKKISIYVFGDDFRGRSMQWVVETIDRVNVASEDGTRLVRIHGIGFPHLFRRSGSSSGSARFATLMRTLAERNGGTFVGLEDWRIYR